MIVVVARDLQLHGYPDPLVEFLCLTKRRSSPRHRLAHPGVGARIADGSGGQPGPDPGMGEPVPEPSGVSRISTVLAPGGSRSEPA